MGVIFSPCTPSRAAWVNSQCCLASPGFLAVLCPPPALWLLQAVFAKRPGRAAAPRRARAAHLLPTELSKGCPELWPPSLISFPGFYPGTELPGKIVQEFWLFWLNRRCWDGEQEWVKHQSAWKGFKWSDGEDLELLLLMCFGCFGVGKDSSSPSPAQKASGGRSFGRRSPLCSAPSWGVWEMTFYPGQNHHLPKLPGMWQEHLLWQLIITPAVCACASPSL